MQYESRCHKEVTITQTLLHFETNTIKSGILHWQNLLIMFSMHVHNCPLQHSQMAQKLNLTWENVTGNTWELRQGGISQWRVLNLPLLCEELFQWENLQCWAEHDECHIALCWFLHCQWWAAKCGSPSPCKPGLEEESKILMSFFCMIGICHSWNSFSFFVTISLRLTISLIRILPSTS